MISELPSDLSDEVLAREWTLSHEDKIEVFRCRGEDNRLRFAIQLCALRSVGRFVYDFARVPVRITNFLGAQLGLPATLFLVDSERRATDSDHAQRIRAYLRFTPFDDGARARLEAALRSRVGEGISSPELLRFSRSSLRSWNVEIPAVSTLERLVGACTTDVENDTWSRIHGRLTPAFREGVDALLLREEDGRSSFFRLKQFPPEPRPPTINVYVQRAAHLRGMAVGALDFSGVRPETVVHFADLARRYDIDDINRFAPPKKYALVACFLAETQKTILDHLVEMNRVYLIGFQRRARNRLAEQENEVQHRARRGIETVLKVLDLLAEDPARTMRDVYREIDESRVNEARERCRDLQHLGDRGLLDEYRDQHSHLKQFLPAFLSLPFRSEPGAEPLLDAIVVARQLHQGERRTLDAEVPIHFIPATFRRTIVGADGRPDARLWEVMLAFAVREALKAGTLYLAESRHHVSFWNLVKSTERWADERPRAYTELKLSSDADHALALLRSDLDAAARAFANGIDANPFASVHSGELVFKRREAIELPPSVPELRRVFETRLPKIRIEELLMEVDEWCGFTRELVPLGGYTPRIEELHSVLLAALVAHGTNLGIATMAQSTKHITADVLQHVSRWYLRPETLKAADRTLVDFHHRLDLSAAWGTGDTASSDGQRFGVQRSSLLAGFYPMYFGYYDRAISVYTHVSNQFSAFAYRAISCGVREATFVLDGLLENDTLVQPREHYTDTHGATDHLFGLCHLLGFSFMPRLADLADQALYKVDRATSYGEIDALFKGAVDTALIAEQWDSLVRVAASLRDRTVPANVILTKLAASSDRLAKALAALGRIVKTTFILRYVHDASIRDRVQLQLNRGESRHALARRLFFANQGAFRSGDVDEIMNKVSALGLLANAVLVWNTVKMADVVRELEVNGHAVARSDIARISPLMSAHVIPSGTYAFRRDSRQLESLE